MEQKIRELEKELTDAQQIMNINRPNEELLYTRLLLRDPFLFYDIITIQKGSKEGIQINAAIINEQGLVGIVKSTKEHSSEVHLITNQKTNISVKIKENYGLLETNSKKEGWIKNLTKECDIQIGDEVYTSGLTEIPAGILIGKVSDLKEDNLGLVKEVKIDFAADIDHISYVIVYQKEMLP